MAVNNLKKKFVGNDQIDGDKILLEQGQSIKAKDALGVEQDILKFGPAGEVLVGAGNDEVAIKDESVQKSGDTMTGSLTVDDTLGATTVVGSGSVQVAAGTNSATMNDGFINHTATLPGGSTPSISTVQAGSFLASGDIGDKEGNISIQAAAPMGLPMVAFSQTDNVNNTSGNSSLNVNSLNLNFIDSAGVESDGIYTSDAMSINVNDGSTTKLFEVSFQDGISFYQDSGLGPQHIAPAQDYNLTSKKYVDDEIAAESTALQSNIDDVADDVSHLVTLSGVAVDSDNLGAFTGVTPIIPANSTIKEAFQELSDAIDAISGGGSGSISALQSELDATQLGAGLETNGSYVASSPSNYLSTATSLKNADELLDAQLFSVETYVTGVEDKLDAAIQGAGLETDGSYIAPSPSSYLAGSLSLKDADNLLDAAIDGVQSQVNDVQSEVNSIETGAGLNSDGTYTASPASNYASSATSLKNADELLDAQIKINTDDIADLVTEDLTFLKLDGSRPMQANLNMMDGLVHYSIVGLADPVNARDAVNKQYVDAIAEGLHVHAPAKALLNASLASATGGSVTYSNGSAGVGATLTLGSALTSIDGYSLQNGDRVIINGEANQAHNGIYTWATGGTVLTRAVDFDSVSEAAGGDFIFVQEGTTYGSSGWVMTETTSAIGTSPIIFVQFSGAGQLLEGDAVDINGNEINVLYDNSSVGVNGSNQLYVKDSGISTAMIQDNAVDKDKIASDVAGIGLQQAGDGSLEIKLDGSSLYKSASGLKSNIVWSKKYFDLTATDISNGYVELDAGVIAEEGSIIGFVDRLAIHEDEDFTVSVVGGKTRIIFAGELIAPGQSQLDANDNLFFKFQKKAV